MGGKVKHSLRCILCAAAVLGAQAFGQTVVVPNSNATVAGNDSSGTLTGPFSARIDYDNGPSQFPSGQIYITGYTWRASPGTGALSVTLTGNIYLSTSPNWPNSNGHTLISTTFANNIGGNNQLVFSGTTTVSAVACATPGPCAFGNNIVFQNAFPYNPANGPLLIDEEISNFTGNGGQFDVQDCNLATNCQTATLLGALNATTGTLGGGGSDIKQFTYTTTPPITATPVPPSVLLTLAGLACVGFYAGRRGLQARARI